MPRTDDADRPDGDERQPRRAIWLLVGGLVVVLVVAAVALEPWTPLTEERADPFAGSGVPAEVRDRMDELADQERQGSEERPAGDEQGRDAFEGRSGVTVASGDAVLIETPEGGHVLRIEGLAVDNGPELRVQLSTLPSDAPSAELGTSNVDLGELRFTTGDANYELSADLDLATYRSVVIWSGELSLPYAVAALTSVPPPETVPPTTTEPNGANDE